MRAKKIKVVALPAFVLFLALLIATFSNGFPARATENRPDGVYRAIEVLNASEYVTMGEDGTEITDNSWQTENKLTKIGGWLKNMDGPVQLVTESGEKGFKFMFHRGNQWAGTSGVKFKESYEGEGIEKIVVRMFAHLSQTPVYGPTSDSQYYGVYLYNLNDDGTPINNELGTGGWKIPVDVQQEQWTDVEITGDAISLFLDDTTGNFKGFQFGARHQWSTGTEAYGENNYVVVSSIRIVYGNYRTVTYEYNDEGATAAVEKKVLFGETAEQQEAPARDGYEFVGWYWQGDIYDFTTPVVSDITLVAEWSATDKFRVNFDSLGGSSVPAAWVDPGSPASEPPAPTKEKCIFDGWYLNGTLYDFSSPVNDNITLTAQWRNMDPIVTDLNGDFTFVDTGLQGVYGTAYEGLTTQYGKGKPAWEKISGEGTKDDSAYKVYFHSYGMTIAASGIKFDAPVDPDEIAFITLRVYAHLSSGATYSTSMGGIRLYALDATGMDNESGYMIPAGIKQDVWTDITLTGNDMKKIADTDGLIRGFQLGAFFHTSSDSELYTGAFSERKAYFAVDGLTVGRKAYVTYTGEGITEDKVASYTGLAFDYRLPDVADKVFLGWFTVDGSEILPGSVLDWDLVAEARFADAATLADGVYWNEDAVGKIGEG